MFIDINPLSDNQLARMLPFCRPPLHLMVTLPCRHFSSASVLSVSSRVFPALLGSFSRFWGPPTTAVLFTVLGAPHHHHWSSFQEAILMHASCFPLATLEFWIHLNWFCIEGESDLVAFFDIWVSSFPDSICWRSSFPVCVFDTSVKEDVTGAVAVWATF